MTGVARMCSKVPTKSAGSSTGGTNAAPRATKWLAAALLLVPGPLVARETLWAGGGWASFRDERPARCYALAQPIRTSAPAGWRPFAGILGRPGLPRTVHIRLSRAARPGSAAWVVIGRRRHPLVARGADAWAPDGAGDEAIVAALRTGSPMRVVARAPDGRRFADSYVTTGAATAIDAATMSCVR